MTRIKYNKGFTLIETIVYIALFGILLSGVFMSAYNIIESNGRNQVKIIMKNEGEFILAKINWAISRAEVAQVPSGGYLQVSDGVNNFEFKQQGNNITLKRNTSDVTPLNNKSVQVINLFFIKNENDIKGIRYGFDLKSNAPNGMDLISHFESTTYLRK
jgi:prepilin-type N-terminal cleavage/methylation domain-containing protein